VEPELDAKPLPTIAPDHWPWPPTTRVVLILLLDQNRMLTYLILQALADQCLDGIQKALAEELGAISNA